MHLESRANTQSRIDIKRNGRSCEAVWLNELYCQALYGEGWIFYLHRTTSSFLLRSNILGIDNATLTSSLRYFVRRLLGLNWQRHFRFESFCTYISFKEPGAARIQVGVWPESGSGNIQRCYQTPSLMRDLSHASTKDFEALVSAQECQIDKSSCRAKPKWKEK